MTFFESLLILLLAAVLLLQVARRLALPYPAMLAAAGVAVAFIPGGPTIHIDPETALALFIAPVLLDAAYDFPLVSAATLWRPLLVMAAGVTIGTAAIVALVGWWAAGLPPAAALALGAIVAPPDAAAAVAVLGAVSLPRRTADVLKGESLFNDAVALLLFTGALAAMGDGGLEPPALLRVAVAVPGGIALGIAAGAAMKWMSRLVANTLGGNVLQFVNVYLVWIVAEHLGLSAVLATVACGMTVARWAEVGSSPRMRVHSFAVWATAVFLLNVLAFLLMGMQARLIIGRIQDGGLWHAAGFAALVIAAITVTRILLVMAWNRLAARFSLLRGALPPPTVGQGLAVAWSGMRGLVTLAAAFALPPNFPQRDLVVLTAFAVVLVTLIVQGLTLSALIRRLGLDRMEDPHAQLKRARRQLAQAAFEQVSGTDGSHDLTLRDLYRLKTADAPHWDQLEGARALGLATTGAQRRALRRLRDGQEIDMELYYRLQEELDWRELTLLPEAERRIHEI